MSISPEVVKQAITEAYNPNNPQGRQQLWNIVIRVMGKGISYEQGNPWRGILEHWSEVEKAYRKDRKRRSSFHSSRGGCGWHSWQSRHSYRNLPRL